MMLSERHLLRLSSLRAHVALEKIMPAYLHSSFFRLQRSVVLCAVAWLLLGSHASEAAFANGTGIARIPNLGSGEAGYGIALQRDGKIVVAGRCYASGPRYCVARLSADGALDATFNPSGTVPGKRIIDGLTAYNTSFLPSVKVRIAADGKIVVASSCDTGPRVLMCVARLNADGSFDDAFNGPDAANPGRGRFVLPITASNNNFLYDAALQRIDGRIVLVGQCANFYQCIARLRTSDGSLDEDSSDFGLVGPPAADRGLGDPGGNGRFLFRTPSRTSGSGVGTAVTVETTPEGKVVIAGSCGIGRDILCLAKLNRDGTWDDDFRGDSLPAGQGGRLIITALNEAGNPVDQRAVAIKMQADGRFLVQCGYFRTSSESQCLYRINSGGTIATSFSSGLPFPSAPGRVVYNPVGTPLAFTVTPFGSLPGDPYANRIVTLGDCDGVGGLSGAPLCVSAILNGTGASDGVLDVSLIGPNGDQSGTFNFSTRLASPNASNNPKEIVSNADGSFLIVGECDGQICVYKFRPDGALDTGPCVVDVDGDGRVLASTDGVAIVRWMLDVPGAPDLAAGNGYDIDGDGTVSSVSDGLMMVRRMLGFTDVGVTGGISIASYARRKTWPEIESYLRTRCNIP
jgi:uncharacterized delta-60 repeat protein